MRRLQRSRGRVREHLRVPQKQMTDFRWVVRHVVSPTLGSPAPIAGSVGVKTTTKQAASKGGGRETEGGHAEGADSDSEVRKLPVCFEYFSL